MIATRRTERLTSFACPGCGEPLDYLSADVLWCAGDRTSYRKVDGIWQLLTPERSAYFDQFVADYDRVRRLEGRGSLDARYFRSLPFADTTGQFRSDWKIRGASFACFMERVVRPLENQGADVRVGRLRVLDLGAGNGWLSNRLSLRGHEVVALELRTDARDGLGACVHYESCFSCVRAEFDHLPFSDGAFDLAVFNASLHYSEDFERTLAEAMRVVKPDGRVCILDSPVYRDPMSGKEMVRRRKEDFQSAYGIASDSLVAEEFLTERRLTQLSARLGLTWEVEKPRYGIGWSIRRFVSRVRNRREPARFAVITGRQSLNAEEAVEHMRPGNFGTAVGRAGLRMRYLATQRHRLRRSDVTQFRGIRVRIPPGVFHPIIFRTGAFLAEQLLADILPADARVLDLGTGSGICAIAAALRGAHVTAADLNPHAVVCARENAALNGVDVWCRRADLFEGSSTFDVVLFNPPYFGGRPTTPFDLAWRSQDVLERFSAELARHLSPGGFALVVLSSDGQCASYLRRFERDGHRITRVAERRHLNETLTVFRIR